jgi:hypothetical protein
MEENSLPHDVTDLLQHDSSSIEKSSCYNNITYNIKEVLSFSSFLLKSRLEYNHNLELLYLIAHCQVTSLAAAATALKVSRALFYNQILPDNPCFLSERRSVYGWGRGGKERRIILSEKAKEHLSLLSKLAELQLGEKTCQQLRIAAEKTRKGVDKIERKQKAVLEDIKKQYLERRRDRDFNLNQSVLLWKKRVGCSKEEILNFLGVELNGPE